jgi:hypothetical protein
MTAISELKAGVVGKGTIQLESIPSKTSLKGEAVRYFVDESF